MSADRKKILLADSDERSRQIVEPSLENGGYEVAEVVGTVDALTALYQGQFDLIISATALADGDGFELLNQCKLDPATSDVPFVMLVENEADGARATEAGASAAISKPVRVRTLVETVAGFFGDAPAATVVAAEPVQVPLDAVFTVQYRSFVSALGTLPESANAVIREFKDGRTLGEAIAASDVDDAEAMGMIPTLIRAEVLVPDEASAAKVRAWLSEPTAPYAQAKVVDPEQERLEAEARAAEEAAREAAEAAQRAAEEARRKADEVRQRAEAEQRRREEAERRLTEQELQAVEEEAQSLESERATELERAREEGDRLLREAEQRAAALEADAKRKAAELQSREAELIRRRRGLTDRLAILTSSGSVPIAHDRAVDAHRESERRAMERDAVGGTLALSPAAAAHVGTPSLAAAATTEPSGPVAAPAAEPSTPPTSFEDPFFRDSQFFAKQSGGDHDDDLFAEPSREGVPPIVWAIGALLVFGVILFLLSSGNQTPEPEPVVDPAPVEEAAVGSAEGSAEEVPAGPTEEELAAIALAQATTKAEQSGAAQGTDVYDTAAGLAETAEPVEPEPAPRAPRAERPRSERPRQAERTPAPTPGATDAEQAMERCASASESGDYEATITACQDAVRLNPRNSDAYTLLGKANYELGNVDAAINYLDHAVRLNGRNRTALLALGAAKQEAGDNAGARQAYETYLEISPDSARAAEVRSILDTL